MLSDEVTILKRFRKLLKKQPYPSHYTLQRFVRENFDRDVAEKCDLIDHTANQLPMADRIGDARYKQFAISVHNIWNDLAKKVDDYAKDNPDRHSFIYVPNCFIGVSVIFLKVNEK